MSGKGRPVFRPEDPRMAWVGNSEAVSSMPWMAFITAGLPGGATMSKQTGYRVLRGCCTDFTVIRSRFPLRMRDVSPLLIFLPVATENYPFRGQASALCTFLGEFAFQL